MKRLLLTSSLLLVPAAAFAQSTTVQMSGDCTLSNAGVTTCVSLRGGAVTLPASGALVASGALATVATSGSYADLLNKPTIPSAYTLPALTTTTLGGAKASARISAAADGTLDLAQQGATTGQALVWNGSTWVPSNIGAGSVTSVSLALPSLFTVTGSPVTGSGTLTGGLASQTANQVFSAPNGANGAPAFRALVAADLPSLSGQIDTAFSATQGSILYRGVSGWLALAPGTSGNVLQSGGTGANPSWVAPSSGGTSTPLSTSPTATAGSALDASSPNIPLYGTAPPTGTAVTYAAGQVIYNRAPTPTGPAGSQLATNGWQCEIGGAPGTWIAMISFSGT